MTMMDKETFRLQAVDRTNEAKRFCNKWHTEARDDYDFIAGDQWKPEDQELLRLANRPDVTFNYSEKMIDAVAGAEVSNRQEVVYKARQIENGQLGELWTNAARWVRDECNGEDEETDSFRDALICGMGWIETKMDYSENKDGMPVLGRNDPMEMYWDPAAVKPGLADRRYDIHGMWMDDKLIQMKWPGATPFSSDDQQPGNTGIIRTGHRYPDDGTADYQDDREHHVDQTMVWHYQCMEMEPYYRVSTGNGQIEEISQEDFGGMKQKITQFGLKYVKSFKRVYYRAFMADETILEWGKSPVQTGFTRQCITGKRNRNKNTWYGLTKVMKDPQRWANKWLAQIMHIINSNSKGGLLAEQGAFVDPRKAEDEWAKPNSITMLNEGAIEKVKQKEMIQYPAGLSQLMEFALNSLPQVTGINLEALGLAGRDQANVLEQSRKQAAYGLLAPVFDSLRRYRKMQGRILLTFIREFISDGRLIKINGVGSSQYIPLTKLPDAVTFDIIVDSSANAPDIKDRTWTTLMQIVPAMIKAGMPLPPDLLTYAPLPQALIQKWQQYMLQHQQQQSPEQMQQMQQELQQTTQENQQLKQKLADKSQELMLKAQEIQGNLALKAKEVQGNLQLKGQELQGNLAIQHQDAANTATLQQQKQEHDMQLSKTKTHGDLKIKAASAGLQSDNEGSASIKIDGSDLADALKDITTEFAQAMKAIVEAANRPKTVVRDSSGRVTGVK